MSDRKFMGGTYDLWYFASDDAAAIDIEYIETRVIINSHSEAIKMPTALIKSKEHHTHMLSASKK